MDAAFFGYEYILDYHAKTSRDQFAEFTFIHHDKKIKTINMSAQVGNDKQLLAIMRHAVKLNEQGYGVYNACCPRTHATRPGRRGSVADVNTLLSFWIDLDSVKEGRRPQADVEKLMASETPPTYCVMSGGGVQPYWILHEPQSITEENRTDLKLILKGITRHYGGDKAASEFARVLRIPGFVNTKPARRGAVVDVIYPTTPTLYTVDDLRRYRLPDAPQRVKGQYSHDDNVEMARLALAALAPYRCEDYEEWLMIGICLQELGNAGLQLWDEWSSKSSRYEPGTCDAKWKTFKGEGPLGHLFICADKDSGKDWRPAKISYSVPAIEIPSIAPLTVGERGPLYRFVEPGAAALIDLWSSGGVASVDDEYLHCIGEPFGLTKRKIKLILNRLPEIFLSDRACLESTQGKTACAEALEHRMVGRPPNAPRPYTLADKKTIHEYIISQAIPKIVKEAFPAKDPLVAPVQKAFLTELGFDEEDAKTKAKEIEKRYGQELAKQPGWRKRMDEVRREVFDLKLTLTGTRKIPDGFSSLQLPIPPDTKLTKRQELLAASFTTIMRQAGGTLQMGHRRLCQLIGCRWNELASVCRAAGVTVGKRQEVAVKAINHPTLLEMCKKYDATLGGMPQKVRSTADDKYLRADSPILSQWALQQYKIPGNVVEVIYHCANVYTFVEPAPVATAPAPDPEPQPAQPTLFDVVTTAMRFWQMWLGVFLFERIYSVACFIWCFLRHLKREMVKKLTYAETWLNKVTGTVTEWQPTGNELVNRVTGELQPASVQLSFDLLLADPSP